MNNQRSLWTAASLALTLISEVMLTVGVAAPPSVAANKHSLTHKERVEVRSAEEKRIASLDKSYIKQMKALARQYRKLANLVAKQGGDPIPLRDAAAYFDKKGKKGEGQRN